MKTENEKWVEWSRNPKLFIQEVIGMDGSEKNKHISNQQEELIEEYRKLVEAKKKRSTDVKMTPQEIEYAKKRGISVQSGQGPGKDAAAAWLIIHFLCFMNRALIPCTAPTFAQLKTILWREITKWVDHSRKDKEGSPVLSDLLEIQTDKIYFKSGSKNEGKEWYAIPRTANPRKSDDEQAETLSGLHEDNMMIVLEEASGIVEPVFRPLEGTMTGPVNFALIIFNPTRTSGYAIRSQQQEREYWICLHWDCEKSSIVEPDHIEFMAKKYGKNSNPYRVRVKGIPPKAEPDTLIPWEWVNEAVAREFEEVETDLDVVGIDVGAGGSLTVLAQRIGGTIQELKKWDTTDTVDLSGYLGEELKELEPNEAFIDNIGIGLGVFQNLRRLGHRIRALDVRRSARKPDKFVRRRDEIWWRVREAFENGLISIPNDNELIGQLSTIKYHHTIDGKVEVETKKQRKARGIESGLDEADAVMMTFGADDKSYRTERMNEQRYKKARTQKQRRIHFSARDTLGT